MLNVQNGLSLVKLKGILNVWIGSNSLQIFSNPSTNIVYEFGKLQHGLLGMTSEIWISNWSQNSYWFQRSFDCMTFLALRMLCLSLMNSAYKMKLKHFTGHSTKSPLDYTKFEWTDLVHLLMNACLTNVWILFEPWFHYFPVTSWWDSS